MRVLIYISAMLIAFPASAARGDLDHWFERDLAPYVREQLTSMPRFRNQAVRFVVMQDDSPQSEGNALVLHLRDRLRDAMSNVPGVRVAWQADRPGVGLVAGASALDCTTTDADYFIGIELQERNDGEISIQVRALDIEERAWVAGFDKTWRGYLNADEYRLLRRYVSDPTFRGERNAPWQDTETDLLAAQLAYELGCQLLGQTDGEYVVAAEGANGNVDPTTALVELVSNNLAGIRALQFADGDTANALIDGKAHRIDDDLFQYWVTITPTDPSSEMTALSADAYVRIPDEYRAAMLVPESAYALAPGSRALLTDFRVVQMPDTSACLGNASGLPRSSMINGGYSYGAGDCYALEVASSDDAVAFFLNHQRNYGLVRLSDDGCGERSLARIVRSDMDVRLPLPVDMLQSGAWGAADSWSLNPAADMYYVIASSDSKAARALSRHIAQLPRRCSPSVRGGVEGEALKQWLEELDAIRRHWGDAIDWRSIRVKDVY